MQFSTPLERARLVKRYKRFLSDHELETGETVTAHCANPGGMIGLKEPGMETWLSPANNPKRKLQWDWQLAHADGGLVGINTSHPNGLVAEAIEAGTVPEFTGYETLRREVKYGVNSRIDILLEQPDRPPCYVEIKNCHLKRDKLAEFPDAVTARGAQTYGRIGQHGRGRPPSRHLLCHPAHGLSRLCRGRGHRPKLRGRPARCHGTRR